MRVARRLRSRKRTARVWPAAFAFTDPDRVSDPVSLALRLPRDVALVFRPFGASDRLVIGRRLRRATARRGMRLFVGADPELAVRLNADGLHLPERLIERKGQISEIKRRFAISAAVHSVPAIRRARCSGVEAMVISAVFPSESPSAGRPLGPRQFAAMARLANRPCYALGGINAHRIRSLGMSRAAGFSAIGAFQADPSASAGFKT